MSFNLFLDDIRDPSDVVWVEGVKYAGVDWDVVRNYRQFVNAIEKFGNPDMISFDHDLAPEHYRPSMNNPDMHYSNYYTDGTFTIKTGYECAQWYVEWLKQNDKKPAICYIHTMNPVGGINIYNVLKQVL